MSRTYKPSQNPVVLSKGVTVPNGSYSAVQTIPVGAWKAWATFDDNVDLLIRHEQDTDQIEAIDACAGWELFPAGEAPPLESAYDVEFQGDGTATKVTVYYLSAT